MNESLLQMRPALLEHSSNAFQFFEIGFYARNKIQPTWSGLLFWLRSEDRTSARFMRLGNESSLCFTGFWPNESKVCRGIVFRGIETKLCALVLTHCYRPSLHPFLYRALFQNPKILCFSSFEVTVGEIWRACSSIASKNRRIKWMWFVSNT